MAPATQAGAEWVHVRPTPPTSTSPGNHPAGPSATPQIPEGSSSLPIIGRRLPASSSFVLAATPAAGAPAGPRTARRHKPAATRKSHNTVTQPGGPKTTRHRVRPPRLLTATTPMGAQMRCLGTVWARIWHDLDGMQIIGLDRFQDSRRSGPARARRPLIVTMQDERGQRTTMPDRLRMPAILIG